MKSWFASSAARAAVLAGAGLGGAAATGPAWAGVDEAQACLAASDVECAAREVGAAGLSPQRTAAEGVLEFHLGHFDKAVELLTTAARDLPTDEAIAADLRRAQTTREATQGFVVESRGDVEIRYQPGLDRVLLDDAFEALEAARTRVAPLLGGPPPGGTRLELYPTAQRFITASGLPPEAVRTTGVIALSKWTRLLVSSPRVQRRGYAWRDTLVHEYIHYVVAYRTEDRCPVWLQEGIARSHEALWRQDAPPPLAPYQSSLLAKALRDNALVPLQRMHPSMAFLSSADETSLAFSQVSTMVETLREAAGAGAVGRALASIAQGADALEAVASAAGDATGDAFMERWKARLGILNLVAKDLGALAVALEGGDQEVADDPGMAGQQDLVRHARLGDLLREAGKHQAALVEYGQAVPEGEDPGPALVVAMAESLSALGQDAAAEVLLDASIADYPEFAATRRALARIARRSGRNALALEHFRVAADIAPFDLDTQGALAELFAAAGEPGKAAHHAKLLRLLQRGGLEEGVR
jgi:tetratricopeptide (TPR) repeat protein